MTTPTAAASTNNLSLDFSTKPTSPAADEPKAFASKLKDAQREAKPAPPAKPAESKKASAEKPRAADDADAPLDATAQAKPTKSPSPDRPIEAADHAAEVNDDKPAAPKDAPATKTADDALLAALAASATPVAVAPDAQPIDAKPHETPIDPVVATVAAAAAIQANAPAAPDDVPDAATAAKPQATSDADAKPKAADAKLDALTAKLKSVADPNAPLPPDAAQQIAGGDAQKHSSHQQQQPSGDGDAPVAKASDAAATPAAKGESSKDASFDEMLSKLAMPEAASTRDAPAPTPAPPTLRPEQQFARDNVDRVVSTVQSHVESGGDGTMNVRLDPPELGALDVAAKMLDGKMSVAFTTSNEQATQLLSHSLNHLKSSLESAGITVDRIEVRQGAPTTTNASSTGRDSSGQQQRGGERGFESATQQQGEQQRKQMVERLWRKYAYGSDEVDLVA